MAGEEEEKRIRADGNDNGSDWSSYRRPRVHYCSHLRYWLHQSNPLHHVLCFPEREMGASHNRLDLHLGSTLCLVLFPLARQTMPTQTRVDYSGRVEEVKVGAGVDWVTGCGHENEHGDTVDAERREDRFLPPLGWRCAVS